MERKITYITRELMEKMTALRREFHRYPETAWTEYRTTWRAAQELEKAGFQVFLGEEVCRPDSRMGLPTGKYLKSCEARALSEGVPSGVMERMQGGKTGAVGILKGEKPGPVRALRFDMDALPVQEAETERNQGYRSLHPGIMHACGHDGHTAAGLGLAHLLGQRRQELTGEVRLLFQPAEEGCRGARALGDQGWLEGADFFLGGHIGIGAERLEKSWPAPMAFLLPPSWIFSSGAGRPTRPRRRKRGETLCWRQRSAR